MIKKQFAIIHGLLIFAAIAPCFAPLTARADITGDALANSITKLAPCVVTIDAVISAQMRAGGQSQDQDLRAQLHGTIVSPDGLIMTTSGYFSSDRIKDAIGVPDGQTSFDVKIVPTEIKITIGNESTQYNGTIAAQDSSLGLAFIQIRDLKGRVLPFIDFSTASSVVAPAIGDLTVSASRLDKSNDFAAYSVEDRISGIVAKPRKAYVPEGIPGGLGMPILNVGGDVIGVLTTFDTPTSSDSSGRASQMLSSLLKDDLDSFHTQFIIPASDVTPKIAEAKTLAASLPPFVPPVPKPPAAKPSAPTATPTPPATGGDVISK